MNKTVDINERTLEKEKKSFISFCKGAEGCMIVFQIIMIIGSVLILLTTILANILKGTGLTVDFTGDYTTVQGIFNNIYVLICSIGMAVAFNFGRNIFRKLKDGETPFRYEIADKIKGAAMAVFVTATIDFIAEIIMGILEVNGIWEINVNITFDYFIWSAILFAIAYIFNYGCKLQQESDETI